MKTQLPKIIILMFLAFFSIKAMALKTLTNFIDMSFVQIPAGEFIMGLKDRDEALMEVPDAKKNELTDESPAHKVVISNAFFMGQTEVTQQQWLRVMGNKPGDESLWESESWQTFPVSSVSWFMAARFVEELNKIDRLYQYRLPTEAEWEYAARAGSNELRPVDVENLTEHAWYIDSSNDSVHPVAAKKVNAYGIYDMLGNLWEWVDDWYDKDIYKQANRTNPQGPEQGWSRVRRGGSFHCPVHLVRPGYRSADKPATRYEVTGFRVVAELKK